MNVTMILLSVMCGFLFLITLTMFSCARYLQSLIVGQETSLLAYERWFTEIVDTLYKDPTERSKINTTYEDIEQKLEQIRAKKEGTKKPE